MNTDQSYYIYVGDRAVACGRCRSDETDDQIRARAHAQNDRVPLLPPVPAGAFQHGLLKRYNDNRMRPRN